MSKVKHYSTPAVLRSLNAYAGLGKDSINFNKLLAALAEGNHIISVLENPTMIAGVAPGQRKWIDRWMSENDFAKPLRREKRDKVIVSVCDINQTESVLGSVSSILPYDRHYLNVNVGLQSGNFLAMKHGRTNREFELVSKIGNYEKSYTVSAIDLTDIMYVNLNVKVPSKYASNQSELDVLISQPESGKDPKWLKTLRRQHESIRSGIYSNGKLYTYKFQTASQERLVYAIFSTHDDFATFIRSLGFSLKMFAKKNPDGTFTVDYTKVRKRFGIVGSSSQDNPLVDFGFNKVVACKKGDGHFVNVGKTIVKIIPDRYVYRNSGKTLRFNPKTKKHEVHDFAIHPEYVMVGDGQFYADKNVNYAERAYFNVKHDCVQGRICGKGIVGKGMRFDIPDLKKRTGADIIIPMSVAKGLDIYRINEFKLLDIVFGKQKHETGFMNLPAMMVSNLKLTTEELKGLYSEHFNLLLECFDNTDKMLEYFKMSFVDVEDAEKDDFLRNTLNTTINVFARLAPFTAKDLYMKDGFLTMLDSKFDKWLSGDLPIKGEYKYIAHDPYTVLFGAKFEKASGKMVIRKDYKNAIPAGKIVSRNHDGSFKSGKCVLGRNPSGDDMQMIVAEYHTDPRYSHKHFFRNYIIMSVFDMIPMELSGADFDGDQVAEIQHPVLVAAAERNHIANGGLRITGFSCPPEWVDPKIDPNAGKYTFKSLTIDEENDLLNRMHEQSKTAVINGLKRNKIGYYTDVQTRMKDLESAFLLKGMTEEAEYCDSKIHLFSELIPIEIDRAKHGGYYESYLVDELEFLTNPPDFIAEYDEDGNKIGIITPNHLAYKRKNAIARNTGSPMCIAHEYVSAFKKSLTSKVNSFKEELLDMTQDNRGLHTLQFELTASFPITQERYNQLLKPIMTIKNEWGNMAGLLMAEKLKLIEDATVEAEEDLDLLTARIAEIEVLYKGHMSLLIEDFASQVKALEAFATPEEIGYVAYNFTYDRYRKNRKVINGEEVEYYTSITFPWLIARDQFYRLCVFVQQGKHADTLFVSNPGTFDFGIGTIGAAQKIASVIENYNEVTLKMSKTKSGKAFYAVFTPEDSNNHVGFVFTDHLWKFAGCSELKLGVTSMKVGGNSIHFKARFVQ